MPVNKNFNISIRANESRPDILKVLVPPTIVANKKRKSHLLLLFYLISANDKYLICYAELCICGSVSEISFA